jgi:TPR repeat protein
MKSCVTVLLLFTVCAGITVIAKTNIVGQETFEATKAKAEKGDAKAQVSLWLMYVKGEGVEKDSVEALKWLRKSAEQGYVDAQAKLGRWYYIGYLPGGEQDYVEAAKWFRKAAEHGDNDSQYMLGEMYRRGQGVEQDDFEALKWYRKAAEQGYAIAQCCLGGMYATGQGVPKSYIEAYKWFDLAAAGEVSKAIENREIISRRMIPSQIAEAQRLSREFVARKEMPDS